MNDFSLWFLIGFKHIVDWHAYDHILFLIVLSAIYEKDQWKQLLVLVTAFTIGHSFTLVLSATHLFSLPETWVEFLIPLTILITAILNLINLNKFADKKIQPNYFLALVFGFIHGMGFSIILKSLLGKNDDILFPLFSFNIGIEAGQIIIVLCIFIISLFLSFLTKGRAREKKLIISAGVMVIALAMCLERLLILIQSNHE